MTGAQLVLSLLATALPVIPAQYISLKGASLNASTPFPDAFVSFSIEFSSFPDFAGNHSSPNVFSDNLLNNLGNLQGTKPYIRVGGNTQDYALYNSSLDVALKGTYNLSRSADYPTTIEIGTSFFESYATWPGVKFSHGFNMGLVGRTPAAWETLRETVPLACKALWPDRWYWWSYGNEMDLYPTSSQGPVRPADWNETDFVKEYLNGTAEIKALVEEHCPSLLSSGSYGYLAPNFGGTANRLKAPAAFSAGLYEDKSIKLFSTHNYISGATSPGVTLQGTLMNHTRTMLSVDAHVAEYNKIWPSGGGPPMIMSETNSLYNEGKPGLSNTFGAALWGVDFNLYCASVGIRRVHMHIGTDYRYGSWQPLTTNKTTMGTKAPYYGNIAVAAFLGDTTRSPVSIVSPPLSSPHEAAYAAYRTTSHGSSSLARVVLLNMRAYNTTEGGTGLGYAPGPLPPRPVRTYTLDVDGAGLRAGVRVGVQRLMANGSDAITGITWDGWSYAYELVGGRPVRLENVTTGEEAVVKLGKLRVEVPDSSAVVLSF